MSGAAPPPTQNSNGRNGGVVGAARVVLGQIVGELPPAFLALLLINIAFLGTVFWFENKQTMERAQEIKTMIDACIMVGKAAH